jgi:hypothetical protein
MTDLCYCFYYDESETPGLCECGHVDDEHDDLGQCTVDVTE